MRRLIASLLLLWTSATFAEGQYDPFSSKDPAERAAAASMRDAIIAGDWNRAATYANTPALRRLYQQARKEYVPAPK